MARRKTRATDVEETCPPRAKNEVVHELAALLTSIDILSQSWLKRADGQPVPVPLGDAGMPTDVAERIGQTLKTASWSVARAAVLLGQHRAAKRRRTTCPLMSTT